MDEAVAARDAALDAVGEKLGEARKGLLQREAELEARKAEAEAAAARARELERVTTRLAERVVARERQVRELRAELARMREAEGESVRALALLAEELEAVRFQARSQATRMRLKALRDAADVGERMGELARKPGRNGDGLLDSIHQAIRRLMGEEAPEAPEDPGPRSEASAVPTAGSNGHAEREPAELFQGLVEVDIGPLSDFAKLVGFEDAVEAIGAASEISVTRFSGGRATLAMRLREPVELLQELEERAPFEFRVRDQRDGRITLDVAE